jgi:hypothetical protein
MSIGLWNVTEGNILDIVGILPQAKYVVYFSMQPGWWDSIDMADALHPQTLVTYGMVSRNGRHVAFVVNQLGSVAFPARQPGNPAAITRGRTDVGGELGSAF